MPRPRLPQRETDMAIPRLYVEPPKALEPLFGLLSVAGVTNTGDGHWQSGIEYVSDNCAGDLMVAAAGCGVQPPKTVSPGASAIGFDPFTLYNMRECRAVGDPDADAHTMAQFLASESTGVEQGLWAQMTNAASPAVNLSGAGAVDPVIGLAILEYWAAQHYGGIPVIHVSRDIGSLLGTHRAIDRRGNRMETQLGSWVAAGGGYSHTGFAAAAAVAGQAWMFVSGMIRVWRGVANLKGPFLVQSPMDNTHISMAERTYVVDTDCLLAAIKVTIA